MYASGNDPVERSKIIIREERRLLLFGRKPREFIMGWLHFDREREYEKV